MSHQGIESIKMEWKTCICRWGDNIQVCQQCACCIVQYQQCSQKCAIISKIWHCHSIIGYSYALSFHCFVEFSDTFMLVPHHVGQNSFGLILKMERHWTLIAYKCHVDGLTQFKTPCSKIYFAYSRKLQGWTYTWYSGRSLFAQTNKWQDALILLPFPTETTTCQCRDTTIGSGQKSIYAAEH